MTLRAQITADPALLAQAAALRRDVFVVEQGVDPQLERDGADPLAWHVVAHDDSGQVWATGRLLDAGDHARLGRIAVRAVGRSSGAGALVVSALERLAGLLGLPVVRLHAQEPVVGFYQRLGYRADGPADFEAGLAHQWMVRSLLPGLRPVRDEDAPGVQELIGGCFAEYPGCVLDLPGIDAWMQTPATARGGGDGLMWVLDAPGGLLASVALAAHPDGVELKSLYVSAPVRRRGYGAALIGLVERAGRERGASRVVLWSDTRFTDAHRLYARLGYRKQPGSRLLHDPSETREWRFDKELAAPPSRVG